MRVKTITLRCTLGEPAVTVHSIQGLPEGVACYWAAEDIRRPAGEAYVVKKRGGRKAIRRFKTAAAAEAHARDWAGKAISRPAKREVKK